MKFLVTEQEKRSIRSMYNLLTEDVEFDGHTFEEIDGKLNIDGVEYEPTLKFTSRMKPANSKFEFQMLVQLPVLGVQVLGALYIGNETYENRITINRLQMERIVKDVESNKSEILFIEDEKEGNYKYNIILKKTGKKSPKPEKSKPTTPEKSRPTTPEKLVTNPQPPHEFEKPIPQVEVKCEGNFKEIIDVATKSGVKMVTGKSYKDTDGLCKIAFDMEIDIDETERFFCKISNDMIYGCKSYDPVYQKVADTIKFTL